MRTRPSPVINFCEHIQQQKQFGTLSAALIRPTAYFALGTFHTSAIAKKT